MEDAKKNKVAIGHFNISNIEGLWGVFRSAKVLNVPVIIGVSEGEHTDKVVKIFELSQHSLRSLLTGRRFDDIGIRTYLDPREEEGEN